VNGPLPLEDEGDPIRVLLVDDHAVVRRGMRSYLDELDDIQVVGEAGDGGEAAQLLASLPAAELPDVVVMDLVMPRVGGVEATEIIRARHASVDVVVMTSYAQQSLVQAALHAGASGYLLKDAEPDEVAVAIRAAQRGQVHLAPAVAKQLTEALRAPSLSVADQELTDRERQVLMLVAQGASNKDIARQLVVSERTARTHVSNILQKLGLRSRTQAALWAVREGMSAAPEGLPPADHASARDT
jgi:DNA-binding NarL/FixJ family response regulator